MSEHFLWVEAYRPKTIDECILPKDQKEYFKNLVKNGEDRKSTRLNSSHSQQSRMPSSA